MDIILFFQSTLRKSWRQKLAGVHRFALEHGWFVQVVSKSASAAEIRDALKEWRPVGCIVDRAMNHTAPPDHVFRDIPTVYHDPSPAYRSRHHPFLMHDSAAEAALAGKELLDLNCASYAYIGTADGIHWDKDRLAQFRKDAKSAGKSVTVLPRLGLKEAITALPKPCGILGANDDCAIRAFHAATTAGFSIPDEVALAGIDNDEIYCESVSPGLTSVEPDFEGAGYRLAQMLETEIKRAKRGEAPPQPPPVETYGPLRIVRRGSTAIVPGLSPSVRRALEHIRSHACEHGLSVDGVSAVMGCSRSLATSRFRKETGHSILDEIHEHRFRKMCELLSQGHLPIGIVVERCGYESDGFAKRLFRQRTGMTMREYRKRNLIPKPQK
jgi:LacI family transcriptional regulator